MAELVKEYEWIWTLDFPPYGNYFSLHTTYRLNLSRSPYVLLSLDYNYCMHQNYFTTEHRLPYLPIV
jgi:hypothetical protein